jgi:hypothetical protein
MRDPDLIVIETFTSQHEADLAKSALEAAGIDAMIKADTAACGRTSPGPAEDFNSGSARKMWQPQAMCLRHPSRPT